jgi:hypothetical protein
VSRRGPSGAGERAARALTQERAQRTLRRLQAGRTAAASRRPGERPPSCTHPRGLPGYGKPSTASRSAAHSPAVKDHSSNHGAQRPARGVGTRCPHAARQPAPAPRLAGAYAACPPARAGPATAVRSHRGLEGLTLTQEPCGITLQMLVRREERSQRDRCRPSDPAHRRRPTPMWRGSPGQRDRAATGTGRSGTAASMQER